MKKVKYLLFFVFVCILSPVVLKAACKNPVDIKEWTAASPFGFDTKVTVCRWVKAGTQSYSASDDTSFAAILNKVEDKFVAEAKGVDDKNYTTFNVGRCSLGEATGTIIITCTPTLTKDCGFEYETENKSFSYAPKGWSCGTPICTKDEGDKGGSGGGGTTTPKGGSGGGGTTTPKGGGAGNNVNKKQNSENTDYKVEKMRAVSDCVYNCSRQVKVCKCNTDSGGKCLDIRKGTQSKFSQNYSSYEALLQATNSEIKRQQESLITTALAGLVGILGYKPSVECSVKKVITCPKYKCSPIEKVIDVCVAKHKRTSDDRIAYCVNPSSYFGDNSSVAKYQVDPTFDVNNCANSYSTRDCGYANILIEGEYAASIAKTPMCTNAINLALRLWGAHTNDKGYNSIGISRVSGSNCSTFESIMSNYNVYKVTKDYITSHFEDTMRGLNTDYINPTGSRFNNISCNSLGLICGNTTNCNGKNTYKLAFDLYFNTLIGNNKMKQHLSELFGGDKNKRPTSVELVAKNKNESYVETQFEEISRMSNKGLVVDCDKLKVGDPNYNDIKPFCNVKVMLVDDNGKKIDEANMAYCIKGDGCVTKTMNYAICDEDITKRKVHVIRVKYNGAKSTGSVKKYTYCGNTTNHQDMFLFDWNPSKTKPTTTTETITEDFPVSSIVCSGTCNNYSARTDMDSLKKCSSQKSSTSYVRDPSLSCIANMGASPEKQYYDYSNYYGVNQNLCKIYCSDEVSYTVPGKTSGKSGLSFDYDVNFRYSNKSASDPLFSNILSVKRTCMSEIYYKKEFPASSISAFQKQFELSGSEFGNRKNNKGEKIKENFTTLYSALVKKSSSEGNRTENLISLLYDLYNCNLYNTDNIKIKKPKDKHISMNDVEYKSVYDLIKNLYTADNSYGIGKTYLVEEGNNRQYDKCKLNSNDNTCLVLDSITYNGGAEVYGKVGNDASRITRVGAESNGEKIKIKHVIKGKNVTNIEYCSNGNNCVSYNPNKDSESYNMKYFGNKSSTTKYVVGGKTYNNVPTNDYAKFEIITEVGFYNNSLFKINPYDGYVIPVTKVGKDKDKYKYADPYTYPLSKDAYVLCNPNGDTKEGVPAHSCKITHTYGNIFTYYRKAANDRLTTAIDQNKKVGCYISIDPPEVNEAPKGKTTPNELCTDFDSCTTYRNVDMESLFPNDKLGGKNWVDDPNGLTAIENIEAHAKDKSIYNVNNDTNMYLEYSVTLDPQQIKNINTSLNTEAYTNNTLYNCKVTETESGIKIYTDCQSKLLDENYTSSNQYGTFTKSDGVSKYNSD